MIDPADWIEAHLDGVRRRGGSYEANCPFCGKAGHLYVHAEEGYFKCYGGGCGSSGRDLVRLIAEVEGVTFSEARKRLLGNEEEARPRRPASPSDLATRVRRLRGREPDFHQVDTAPPASMVPVWDGQKWRVPRYLTEKRGMTRRLARRFGLGFCRQALCDTAPTSCEFPADTPDCVDRGRCRYGDRIILPFSCPNGRAFTTRAALDGQEPKYLNPPGPRGRLLYGWQNVQTGGELIFVEGPFDVLRLAAHGLAAVAVMGLSLGSAQVRLVGQAHLSSVTLMLDAGVETEAQLMAADLLGTAGAVFIARLPAGIDPGSSTREQAWEAFRGAQRYTGDRGSWATAIGEKLRAVTS